MCCAPSLQRMQLRDLLLLCLSAALVSAVAGKGKVYLQDDEAFPGGWRGELPSESVSYEDAAKAAGQQPSLHVGHRQDGSDSDEWRGTMIQASWKPRVFLLKNFLQPEECDHLIAKATPSMTKSSVVNSDTGESEDSTVRTSSGTFFSRKEDDVIARIERRVSLTTMLPEENAEGMQVLHYTDGQKYEAHHDYFHDSVNSRPEHGGNRVATVLMYLSDVEEGGETVFPHAEHKVSGPGWSECALQGLAVHPRKGDAVLFYSMKPDGTKDPLSLHGSCPTIKGHKWSATKWIHVGGFGMSSAQQKAKWGDCVDAHDNCPDWSAMGECEKNQAYMHEYCRKSCQLCSQA